MNQEFPNKILIILLGAIGDVARGLSLAVRIKEQRPEVFLAWAVEPRSKDLVLGHPAIDKVLIFDRPRGFKAYREFLKELKSEHFDLTLDMQRHFKSGFTSFATNAKTRIGFNPKNAKEFNWIFNNSYIPAVENFSAKIEHYHLFGDQLGLEKTKPYRFNLKSTPQELDEIEKIVADQAGRQGINYSADKSKVVLIVGSTWPSRFWSYDKYCEVISRLRQKHDSVFFVVGGKSEETIASEIVNYDQTKSAINLTLKTSLRQLVSVFEISDLAIGLDSGPMHICAAVGKPVISLFGSTSPKRSAPYGSEHLVVEAGVSCAPCYKRECPGLGDICMKNIKSTKVAELADQILQKCK